MSLEEVWQSARAEIQRVIFGQDGAIDLAMVALFSGGHVLLEGPPGTAKTLLVRTIASALQMDFRRIQMAPDLLPGDVTGSSIYREDLRVFEFHKGPIFANFVLADEINRASARTQSALLEAMQEQTVTYDGVGHPLPKPFIVFATLNPLEEEGIYPLPLAQLDRFMFKILIGYPKGPDEERILKEHSSTGTMPSPSDLGVRAVVEPRQILESKEIIRQTQTRDEVISYVRSLVHATREDDALAAGASPRAGLMLLMAAKGLARLAGRDYVIPDDVKKALLPTLRHRVVLSAAAELEGRTPDEVLRDLADLVEVPR